MIYRIEGNCVHTEDGTIKFSKPIDDSLVINNTLVICLEIMGVHDDINNIYGINKGKIAWQVQDLAQYDGEPCNFHPGPYTGLGIYSQNPDIICANTFYGIPFLIDAYNGRIVGYKEWTK